MSNFKISPLYTSEIEAVTMMSGYALLTGELTHAVFPPPKINPENPHEELNFRVKRIRKRIISSGGHFFNVQTRTLTGGSWR